MIDRSPAEMRKVKIISRSSGGSLCRVPHGVGGEEMDDDVLVDAIPSEDAFDLCCRLGTLTTVIGDMVRSK